MNSRTTSIASTAAVLVVVAALIPLTRTAAHASAAGCGVVFTDTTDWGSGFTANVTMTDTGTAALTNWTLTYTQTGSQTLVNGWNGSWTQSGVQVKVTSPSYQLDIAPGQSYTTGANFDYSGANPAPTNFAVDGIPCTGSGAPSPSATSSPSAGPSTSPSTSPSSSPSTSQSSPPGGVGLVSRKGTQLALGGQRFRFGGANIYWLGLDENVGGVAYPTHFRIDDALQTAKAMGSTVVRSHTLGVSTGNSLSVEPALGQFNDAAFDTIDYSVAEAGRLGIHLVVPLTDNYHYFHGGKHDFTDWLGLPESSFYTDPRAISAFEAYISHLLNHVNPYTGLAYKDDPAVMSWELGNELTGMNQTWVETVAAYLKQLSPDHLVAAPWDSADYGAQDVDIVDAHYYPPSASAIANDSSAITAQGKVYLAGEYGWTSADGSVYNAFQSTGNVSGALFWSLFPHADNYGYVQHNDGFTLHYPGDGTSMQQAAASITQLDDQMANLPVGPAPAPGKPQITSAQRSGGRVVLAWRGATTAGKYSVLRSASGVNGPWQTICSQCATDNNTPWTDSSAPSGTLWYAVVPYTLAGTVGPQSDPVAAN